MEVHIDCVTFICFFFDHFLYFVTLSTLASELHGSAY